MIVMNLTSRNAALFVVVAAGLMPAAGAQAQWYSSNASPPPLYPYAVQANRPYAVEVAPKTYVIQRPGAPRQPALMPNNAASAPMNVRKMPAGVRSKVDPALVEELRNRPKVTKATVETTQIVREKPVVVETKRYVDDPPRVIERYTVADDKPARKSGKQVATADVTESIDKPDVKPKNKGDEKRVINAEAEITILGPDRMSIRLFRKGDGTKAKASAE